MGLVIAGFNEADPGTKLLAGHENSHQLRRDLRIDRSERLRVRRGDKRVTQATKLEQTPRRGSSWNVPA